MHGCSCAIIARLDYVSHTPPFLCRAGITVLLYYGQHKKIIYLSVTADITEVGLTAEDAFSTTSLNDVIFQR